MKNIILFILLLVYGFNAIAQSKDAELKKQEQKLNQVAIICDQKIQDEKYKDLIRIADSVLKLLEPSDHFNQSLFLFYKSTGYINPTDYKIQLQLLDASLEKAKLANDSTRIINAQVRIMEIYSENGGYSEQQKALAQNLETTFNTTHIVNSKETIISPLANYFNQLGLYEKEINYRIKGIEMLKARQGTSVSKRADTSNIGVALYNLGSLYLSLKNYEKANEYLLQSIQFLNDYKIGIAYAYKDLSIANLNDRDIAKAEKYRDAIMGIDNLDFKNASASLVASDLAFAAYYSQKKASNRVAFYLKDARELLNKNPDDLMQVQFDGIMGTVLMQGKKYSEALPYLLAAKPKMLNIGVQEYLSLLQDLAKTYAGLGKWELAYTCYDEYAPLRDSVFNIASKQSFANAEAKFQNKEKQQVIDAKNIALKFSRQQRLYMLAGIILMALVILLLIIYYRNKRKAATLLDEKNKILSHLNQELTEANQTKAKLFGILSHDLRSPISQVYQFLKLQQMEGVTLDEDKRSRLNDKVQSATGSLLETMEELLLWSKTQMNHFEPKIASVNVFDVIQECLKLLQLNIEAKNINFKNSVSENQTTKTDEYFLQTILRNLLQNAVKAAPENTSISIDWNENTIIIQNQGEAFTQKDYEQALKKELDKNSLSGLGLKLAEELSGKINARISFGENKISNSTSTFLKL